MNPGREIDFYDGDAHVSACGKRVRVWIEAPNVTAEVYITRRKAKEIRDAIEWILAPPRSDD